MSLPRMSLHIGDYLKDTTHLDAALHGAYLLLIMHYWANGELPDDDRQLSRIARMSPVAWRQARPVIQEFFYDGWRHKRIEKEIVEAQEKYERHAAAGRKGGRPKKPRESQAFSKQKQPITDNRLEDVDDDARAKPGSTTPLIPAEAFELADKITVAAGHDPKFVPPSWAGAPMHVAKWLRQGWPAEIILIAVQAALAKKRDGPPHSIIYFEKPIAAEIARQAAPLPTVKILEAQEVTIGGANGQNRGRGGAFRARLDLARRASEQGDKTDRFGERPAIAISAAD
jgi:uncharacterized protein YdaU (DUF1376 family)